MPLVLIVMKAATVHTTEPKVHVQKDGARPRLAAHHGRTSEAADGEDLR